MKRLAGVAVRMLLAVAAGCSWALVYPYDDMAGDWVLGGSVACFVLAVFFPAPRFRALALEVAMTSAAAGLLTVLWSALSWRAGWWYPDMPRVLHHLFGTNGEASYNASDGQLFLLLFAFLMAVWLSVKRWRRVDPGAHAS